MLRRGESKSVVVLSFSIRSLNIPMVIIHLSEQVSHQDIPDFGGRNCLSSIHLRAGVAGPVLLVPSSVEGSNVEVIL